MLWSTPRAIRMSGTIETWNLKDNSRHAPSWKTFEDEVMPAELDQEVMHWLQNHVQPHDSMSVREIPIHHSHENLDEYPAHQQYQRHKETCYSRAWCENYLDK